MIISKENARHYMWGDGCDGWEFLASDGLLVIEERMPPGTSEKRHFHKNARQFFRLLFGHLSIEMDGVVHDLNEGEGLEIPPGVPHQVKNRGHGDARFLAISSPSTRHDRVDDL